MNSKRKINIMFIIISVLLLIGIVTVYIIGEKMLSGEKSKKIVGAEEVNSVISENQSKILKNNDNSQKLENDGTSTLKTIENNPSVNIMINENKFEGKTLKLNDKGLPILMYHSIDTNIDPKTGKLNELKVPKEVFREQMRYFKDNGFTTLTMSEAYDFFQNNKGIPAKSVLITFDDGYVDNYLNAYPVLKEFSFNATVFMITDLVDKDSAYLNSSQLKEMESNGIEIQNHTVNHLHLSTLSYNEQLKQIKDSKEFLEKLLNKKVDYIAYPYGDYNGDTLKIVKELGIKMGVLASGPWAFKKDGEFLYRRVYISSLRDMNNFIERLTNPNFKTNW